MLKNEREIRGLKRYMFERSRMIQKEEDWVMLEQRLYIPKVSYLAFMFKFLMPKSLKSRDIYIG